MLAYGDASRLWKVTDPKLHLTTYDYDASGNRSSIKNALNETTYFEYDLLNRLTKVTSPSTTAYNYGYDAMNRLTSIKDSNNHTQQFVYDLAGRLTTEKDALLRETQYGYDKNNNRTSVTDRNGGTTTYTYDPLNRVTQVVAPGSLTISFVFDDAGRQTEMTDSTGTTTYLYDEVNRLKQKTVPGGRSISYDYDVTGNVTTITDFSGQVQSRTYDIRNRLESVTAPGSTATTYTYDGANRWTSRTYPTGVKAEVTRDANGNISELRNLRADASVISTFQYAHDALDRVTSVVDSVGTTQYSYDSDGRLKTVTEPDGRVVTYGYDGAGNRTSRSVNTGGVVETTAYGYDDSDRLSTVTPPSGPAVNYTYDPNGNMTGNGTRTFGYDGLNRLVSVQEGTTTLGTYKYDGTGLRSEKTTGAGTTRYYYDGDRVVNEGDAAGTITASNFWGLDLLRRDKAGQTGYYLYNGHGDVVSILSPTGSESAAYRYGAFGEPATATGTADNPFRYTTEPLDEETGFIYLRARYYDPALGRFITQDTWKGDPWQPWTQNLYVYVGNNPVNYIDPTGHVPVAIPALYYAGAALLGAAAWLWTHPITISSGPTVTSTPIYIKGAPLTMTTPGTVTSSPTTMSTPAASPTGTTTMVTPVTSPSEVTIASSRGDELVFTPHALDRLNVRGWDEYDVREMVDNTHGFRYYHDGLWKIGYWDAQTGLFIGTVGDSVTTVMTDITKAYVDRLKKNKPENSIQE